MNTGGDASCREFGTLQPKRNYHHQNRRAYFTKKGHGSKIIFNERRRHRRSASDSQNPQPSRPTDPRPATRASAALRSIPNDLTSRNPLANASRRSRSLSAQASGAICNTSRAPDRCAARADRSNTGVFIKQK